MVVLTLPFHAFLGVTIMQQTSLIGGSWYPDLHQVLPWLPDAAADQRLAGGILWGSGDLIGLLFFAVLFVQWVRSSMREAVREDRRLDRLEAQQRAGMGSIPRVTNAAASTPPLQVLVYSDDVNVRQQVMFALGRRVHPDLPELEYVEVATEPVVLQQMDAGRIDLAILDGEAVPAGGMGIAKQLKDEIFRCPPILVLTGRPQDAWLATWSRAEAAVLPPDRPAAARRDRGPAAALRGRPRPADDRPRHLLARRARRAWSRARDLGASRPPGRWARSCPVRPRPRRSPGSPSRCAPRARRSRRSRDWSAAMYEHATPLTIAVGSSTSSAPVATGRSR